MKYTIEPKFYLGQPVMVYCNERRFIGTIRTVEVRLNVTGNHKIRFYAITANDKRSHYRWHEEQYIQPIEAPPPDDDTICTWDTIGSVSIVYGIGSKPWPADYIIGQEGHGAVIMYSNSLDKYVVIEYDKTVLSERGTFGNLDDAMRCLRSIR